MPIPPRQMGSRSRTPSPSWLNPKGPLNLGLGWGNRNPSLRGGGSKYRKAKLASAARSPTSSNAFLKPRGSRGGSSHTNPSNNPNHEVIYFGNITNGSKKAAEEVSARFSHCGLFCLAEVHDRVESNKHFYSRLKGVHHVVGPAEQSDSSIKGTYGGTSISVNYHVQWAPLTNSEFDFNKQVWKHEMCHAYNSVVLVKWVNIGPVFIFSQYHKDGINHSLFKLVAEVTKNGKFPFIILADFNAKPEEVGQLHWMETLKSTVITTGQPTCFGGEGESVIDFVVCSDVLLSAIHSLKVISEVPWGPHALLELTVDKAFEKSSLDKQVLVGSLSQLPELLQGMNDEQIMFEWGEAEIEAQPDIENHRDFTDAHLDHHIESSLALFRWCRTLEYWYIRLWNKKFPETPIVDKGKFLGRGLPPSFKNIPLKREGNKDIFGNIDFGSHETVCCRSLLLLERIVKFASKPNPRPFWITRLKLFISNFHAQVVPYLSRVVGYRACVNLFTDLCQMQTCLVGFGDFPPNLVARMKALLKKTSRLSKEQNCQEWIDNVKQMLDKNLKGAHKFCNSHNLPTKLITKVSNEVVSIRETVNSSLQEWDGVWGGDMIASMDYSSFVEEIRKIALESNKPYSYWRKLVTPAALRAAAKSFNDNTSSDQLSTQLISELPDCVLEEFCTVFLYVIQQASLPACGFEVFLFLLPKKLGGFRTIGMFPTFYRLLMKLLSPEFRDWDSANANQNDTAQKGVEAEYELYKKQIIIEVAKSKGLHFVQFLFDFKKYYDHIIPSKLLEEVEITGFPLLAFALSLQGHSLPRRITMQGHFSRKLNAFAKSIVAGCTSSTSIARMQINGILEKVFQFCASYSAEVVDHWFQHVDDVSCLLIGPEKLIEIVARELVPVFIEASKQQQLVVSPKTAVVGSTSRLTKFGVELLKENGVEIDLEDMRQVQDIGVERAPRRSLKIFNQRLGKNVLRARKGRVLDKIDKRAHGLFKAGPFPSIKYGYRNVGLPPSKLKQMDRLAASSIHTAGFQPSSLAVLSFDLKFVPSVTLVRDQITWWVRYWGEHPDRETFQIWRQLYACFLLREPHERWRLVEGPIGATIATLFDIGFKPKTPHLWVISKPDGMESTAMLGLSQWRDHAIIREVTELYCAKLWAVEANKSFCLSCLALETRAPLFIGFERAKKKFLKDGKEEYLGSLKAVVGGGCLVSERFAIKCDLCGCEDCTAFHKYYDCPFLRRISNGYSKKWIGTTRHFRERALVSEKDSLYFRGILPASMGTQIFEKENVEPRVRVIKCGDLSGNNLHMSTDGGGVDPRWRSKLTYKVGSGCVVVNWGVDRSVKGIGLVFGEVPNPYLQTVPRAEVWGPVMGLQALDLALPNIGKWDVDASYVSSNSAKLRLGGDPRKGPIHGVHGDVWEELLTLARGEPLLVPHKVTSHLDASCIGSEISVEEFVLNGIADKLAEFAVQKFDYPTDEGLLVEQNERNAFLACMRLAVVEFERANWASFNVVKRDFPVPHYVPETHEVIPLIHRHIKNNGHQLEVEGRNIICLRCGLKVPKCKVQVFENRDCGSDEVFDITCPEDFVLPGPKHVAEDLLANLQPKLTKAQQEVSQVKAEAKKAIYEAAQQYVERLPLKGTTLRTAPILIPSLARSAREVTSPWIKKLHHSHKLWAAGGLAFCSECGAVSSGGRKTRLSLVCGSKPGMRTTRPKLIGEGKMARRMPGGSEWRIKKLLSGTLVGKSRWPDGTSKEVTIVPTRVFPGLFSTNSNVESTQEQSSEALDLPP